MKKKTIAPENFQTIDELQPFKFENSGRSPYSWFILGGDLQEFRVSEFEVFSDEELKAMAFTKEELKAISWNLDSSSEES
jgi:hypothetical protein